ncbi:hypothetical protein [Streptomyces sp. NPDC050704]|uniref:DUF6953 family protein n=1 Tax=Streptomyces sp. NPDC050704 TaxID=3157219 RepID=UPI003412AD3B
MDELAATGAQAATYAGAVQAAAQWLLAQITGGPNHELWQMDAAEHIEKNFDDGLTYENDNGNTAISPKVLTTFRAISVGTVVWERGTKSWRLRTPHDPDGKRQAD